MRKPRSVLILLVLLFFGFYLSVPAENLLETAYDESDILPYEGPPLFLIVVVRAAPTRAIRQVLSSSYLRSGAQSVFTLANVQAANAKRSADAPVSLSLLCTLLC